MPRCRSIVVISVRGGLLALGAFASALAQSPALDAAKNACASDLQQFCQGVQPGGGRMIACLKEHRDQVSLGCQHAVKSAMGGAGAPATAASPAPPAPAAAPVPPAAPPAPPAAPNARPMPHAAGTAASGSSHYFRLKKMTANMNDSGQMKPVYSLLAPEDWKLDGTFFNNTATGSCFSDLYSTVGSVVNADGTVGMGLFPHVTYRYADSPQIRQQMEQRDRVDERAKLKGCPIRPPMHAADYLKENVVWKQHTDKPAVTAEPFPELEAYVRRRLGLEGPDGAKGGVRVEAARVHVSSSTAKGVPDEEWWSGVVVARPMKMGPQGVAWDWHVEQLTVFQAPPGKLDGYDKLYRVMAMSVREDPAYAKWSGDQIAMLYKARAQSIQIQNQAIAALQQYAADTIQSVTANMQRGSLQAAFGADQLVRGVQTFRDPSTGRTVELSNLYDHAWANGNDQYIVTDDSNFNPNGHVNGNWGELQLVRPAP